MPATNTGKLHNPARPANLSRRRHAEIRSCHFNPRLPQFTVTLTVASSVVVLLGAAPFSSAPVKVNVYVFLGVVRLLALLLDEPQAGSKSNPLASINNKSAPMTFFRRLPVEMNPTNPSPGTHSHRA